jgi:plastocyanin
MLADRTLRLAAALTAVLALTACGKTARTRPTSKATPVQVPSFAATVNPAPTTPPPSATASESGSPATTASASATGGGGGGNAVHAVGGATNRFEPATLTVKAGTTVTWTAEGYHSADSGKPPTPDAKGPIHAPAGFTSYQVTFKTPGTYKYFCVPHASLGMTGEIVVT